MASVRPAAVAGTFYPRDSRALITELDDLLGGVEHLAPRLGFPKALIVPHAGYIYSGPVAARAYDEVAAARGVVRRVVMLGPVHRVPVRGLALPGAQMFETPLGRIPIDQEAIQEVSSLPQVVSSEPAHALEHALEPLAVGTANVEEVAQVIERLWGGRETLIVISTDMSHYHAYEEARRIDGATVDRIGALATDIDHDEACGATPLNGLLSVAKKRNLSIKLLAACNSGDTAGGKGQVVGYSSFALYEGGEVRHEDAGSTLVSIASGSISNGLGLGPKPEVDGAAWLDQAGATFVTLLRAGKLRGCVGSLEAARPIGADVADNALGAAFRDPRFPALTRDEWPQCSVEVSLLSVPKPIQFADEDQLLALIRAGEDGLILEADGRRATFLPQVWESIADTRQFLDELMRKAGVPAGTRLARCRLSRYRVIKWKAETLHA